MQNRKNIIKRIVDAGLTLLLLCLMAFQVTGEEIHEWIGVTMTVLVIIHHILNIKWYGGLFKGRYHPYRIVLTLVNVLLMAAFLLTAFCGMSMSGYAVPFLYGMAPISFVRMMHLSISHWSFVLMGLHLGLHVRMIFSKFKPKDTVRVVLSIVMTAIAGIGFWLFLRSGMSDYLFFKVGFVFLDYEKSAMLVFIENILMILFWAFVGHQLSILLVSGRKKEKTEDWLYPVIFIIASVAIGVR